MDEDTPEDEQEIIEKENLRNFEEVYRITGECKWRQWVRMNIDKEQITRNVYEKTQIDSP